MNALSTLGSRERRGTFRCVCLALATALTSISSILAQTYPTKLIRIVTTQPGGGSDVLARVIAPPLSASLGQPVVVDNRTALASIREE
jgi:tripartite-type tricarboxylate transporter receptor subunit TctC